MNNEHYQELIDAVQGGIATEEQAREYRRLLEADAEFRAHAEFIESLRAKAHSIPQAAVSADFASRVATAARSNTRSSRIEAFQNRSTTLKSILVDFVPKSRGFAIAIAVHACVLLILAFVFLTPNNDKGDATLVAISGAPHDLALQRASAPRFALGIEADGGLNLSSLSVQSTLYLLRMSDSRLHVLLAYTAAQIEKLDPALKDQAFPARVVDGRIRLSRELIDTGLALTSSCEVMVVALNDRIEIWNRCDFDGYIRTVPVVNAAII